MIVPADASLSVVPNRATFKEGDDFQLNCSVTGIRPPDVVWYQNGKERANWMNKKLVMLKAAVSHNGTFQCNANNDCGKDTDSVMVQVEGQCLVDRDWMLLNV